MKTLGKPFPRRLPPEKQKEIRTLIGIVAYGRRPLSGNRLLDYLEKKMAPASTE